jgi:hypothetical protein
VELFRGKTIEELDGLAASFKLENCVLREELNEILRADAETSPALPNAKVEKGLMTGQKEQQQQRVEQAARL